MTMKEKLQKHREIERENAEHLRRWKAENKDPERKAG